MRVRVAIAALGLALAACDDPPPPTGTRGAGATRGPVTTAAPLPSPVLPPGPTGAPGRDRRASSLAPAPVLPSAPAAAPSAEVPGAAGPSLADRLRDALRAAFGTPTQCLSEETRGRLSERLVVTVTASVSGTGRVTRASISSAALSTADRECMRQHAETLRLALEVPEAPRNVTATIEYDVRPATAGRTEREVMEQAPVAGRVAPDRTLPSAGTVEGRPAGAVAPDLTLEAEGTAQGRPAGSVAPSFTLPAVAP